MKKLLLLILLLTPFLAPAADWQQLSDRQKTHIMWQALALHESDDNDWAVGTHNEVGAFQIRPREWRSMTGWPIYLATNRPFALYVSQKLMQQRVSHYVDQFGHLPTLFEWYVLYNAPAQLGHPSADVTARAKHFVTLCLN